MWVLGIKASLLKSISALNHRTSSPAPRKRAFSLGVKGGAIHFIFKGTKNPVSGHEEEGQVGKEKIFKGLQEILLSREESRKVTKSLRDRT